MTLELVRNEFVRKSGRNDLKKKYYQTNGDFSGNAFGWEHGSDWSYSSSSMVFDHVTTKDFASTSIKVTADVDGRAKIEDETITASGFGWYTAGDLLYISNLTNFESGFYFIDELVLASTGAYTTMYLRTPMTVSSGGSDESSETAAKIRLIGQLRQSVPYLLLTEGQKYTIEYTVDEWNAGTIYCSLDTDDPTMATSHAFSSESEDFSDTMYANGSVLTFWGSHDFDGNIDSVVVFGVEDVTSDTNLTAKADIYINEGQRYLDGLVETPATPARIQKDVAAGTATITLQGCKSVRNVWIQDSDGRYQLKHATFDEMRYEFSDDWDDIDQGTPEWYCLNVARLGPEQSDLTSVTYTGEFTYDHDDLNWSSAFTSDGTRYYIKQILIMPPPDQTYTVTIEGDFVSPTLLDDDDTSYWTEIYPEVLCYASLRALAAEMKDTSGVRHWEYLIGQQTRAIQKDIEYEKSNGVWGFGG